MYKVPGGLLQPSTGHTSALDEMDQPDRKEYTHKKIQPYNALPFRRQGLGSFDWRNKKKEGGGGRTD